MVGSAGLLDAAFGQGVPKPARAWVHVWARLGAGAPPFRAVAPAYGHLGTRSRSHGSRAHGSCRFVEFRKSVCEGLRGEEVTCSSGGVAGCLGVVGTLSVVGTRGKGFGGLFGVGWVHRARTDRSPLRGRGCRLVWLQPLSRQRRPLSLASPPLRQTEGRRLLLLGDGRLT